MLAHLVNHMLEEIERLMTEVKSACDGIAHDLRTPAAHIRTLLANVAGTHARHPGRRCRANGRPRASRSRYAARSFRCDAPYFGDWCIETARRVFVGGSHYPGS